ncbi:MAG: bacteriocin, lactococcin 972 family protein [Lactobacillales bacterium]|jgi:hypothetical protein|nr:bacteriocin, lactococcin 972 family protein [Lactobacillales bacterium]
MKKFKNSISKGFLTTGLLVSFIVPTIMASATTEHPHPTYLDNWNYGVTSDNWAYSDYYLEAPIRLGSSSSVTDIFGKVKDFDKQDYGWAKSGAKKTISWVRANCYYGWYNF